MVLDQIMEDIREEEVKLSAVELIHEVEIENDNSRDSQVGLIKPKSQFL